MYGTIFILPLAKQFTLGSNERLKSRKQIEQLFKEGKSFSLFPYKVYYLISPVTNSRPSYRTGSLEPLNSRLRFSVGVGTRNFKKAPDRNRIKRLTREAYRLRKLPLQQKIFSANQQLNIFFIYTGKELPDHLLVKEKTVLILNRLIKVVDENIVADS